MCSMLDLGTLTDEEVVQALDRQDPWQKRAEEILLALPTRKDLDETWLSPDEQDELRAALQALRTAVEAVDAALHAEGKAAPKMLQAVIDAASQGTIGGFLAK